MPLSQNLTGLPGVGSTKTSGDRRVFMSSENGGYLPGGRIIKGSASRDPGNTGDVDVLRAGLLMGKITSGGLYAPAILGVSTEAITGASTTITVSAAVATEIVRRIGATGTFKFTGPPTASGTVRTVTVTYSAVNTTTGAITVTAIGVADVWTLTAPAGQDAGMYQLEVTTGKGTSAEVTAVTAALAANAITATVDAALEALPNVGAAGVAAVYSDPTLTLTFASALGPVYVRVLTDTTNDGGVFEGGWAAVHTTTGVDGRFIAGSFVQPTDGSETILTFIADGDGVRVTDQYGASQDQPFDRLPISGILDASQFLPVWPSDTSLRAHIVSALTASSGGKFVFNHPF